MSRIGRLPITVPEKVKVQVKDRHVSVEGPKGKLAWDVPKRTQVSVEGNQVSVARDGNDREARSLHGLTRSLIHNMVIGVHDGFVKKLEIQGVGFKADVQGAKIVLNLGYSHPIHYAIPESVKVTVQDGTKVTVEGPDKQVVGRVAAELRSYYPAEPYKGKGVRYEGEQIIRKEGKTVQ